MNPSELIVTLKGRAKDWTTGFVGIYVLRPNLVNDNPHWLQVSGSKAIWTLKDSKIWSIGHQDDLGGNRVSIASLDIDEVAGPQEVTTWQYFDGLNFIPTSDDILVDTFVKSGPYMIYIGGLKSACKDPSFSQSLVV